MSWGSPQPDVYNPEASDSELTETVEETEQEDTTLNEISEPEPVAPVKKTVRKQSRRKTAASKINHATVKRILELDETLADKDNLNLAKVLLSARSDDKATLISGLLDGKAAKTVATVNGLFEAINSASDTTVAKLDTILKLVEDKQLTKTVFAVGNALTDNQFGKPANDPRADAITIVDNATLIDVDKLSQFVE